MEVNYKFGINIRIKVDYQLQKNATGNIRLISLKQEIV